MRQRIRKACGYLAGIPHHIPRKRMAPYTDDILMGAGVLVAVATTYSWSAIAGGYALAASLIGAGVVLARQPPRR